jgi:hypothetical protein
MAPQLYRITQTHPPFQNMLQYLNKCICSQCCFSKLRVLYFHHRINFYWLLGYMSSVKHFRCMCQKICLLFTCQILEFHNSILILRVQWVGVKRLNVVPKLRSLDSDKHCIKAWIPVVPWFFSSFPSASTDINWYSLLYVSHPNP